MTAMVKMDYVSFMCDRILWRGEVSGNDCWQGDCIGKRW
jgi:hypothetical protein